MLLNSTTSASVLTSIWLRFCITPVPVAHFYITLSVISGNSSWEGLHRAWNVMAGLNGLLCSLSKMSCLARECRDEPRWRGMGSSGAGGRGIKGQQNEQWNLCSHCHWSGAWMCVCVQLMSVSAQCVMAFLVLFGNVESNVYSPVSLLLWLWCRLNNFAIFAAWYLLEACFIVHFLA